MISNYIPIIFRLLFSSFHIMHFKTPQNGYHCTLILVINLRNLGSTDGHDQIIFFGSCLPPPLLPLPPKKIKAWLSPYEHNKRHCQQIAMNNIYLYNT